MKEIITGLGIVVALVLGVVGLNPDIQPTIDNAVKEATEKFGALTGPDIGYPYLQWGGVYQFNSKTTLNTATTTPCAIQAPAATSTLVASTVRIDTGTSTATVWTVAKAATAFATTTPLLSNITLGSTLQGTMGYFGTSTASGVSGIADPQQIIGPNQWIVWGVAGVQPANTANLNGVCSAQFIVI